MKRHPAIRALKGIVPAAVFAAACISCAVPDFLLDAHGAGQPEAGLQPGENIVSKEDISALVRDSFSLMNSTPGAEKQQPFEYLFLPRHLPSRFSLIEEGKKPQVRSQGSLETCWAITACSAIESDLLPDETLVFSPDHMSIRNGYSTSQEDGGDYHMIMSYLADWKGPVTEAEDPYGDGESPEGLKAAVHVHDIRMLRGMSRDQIKEMMLTYGAVQSSLCMDRARTDTDDYHYYQEKTCAYYDPMPEDLNHDVLVLGWDDAYSRENFRIRPRNDGAWICQNTWGEDFGQDGIFYVSYEDRNLFRKGGLAYSGIVRAEPGAGVYGTDSLGWQGRQGYGREQCWFAGVFTSDRTQRVTGIGFYTTGPYTAYRIYLIPGFESEADLTDLPGSRSIADGAEAPEDQRSAAEAGAARLLAAGQFAHPGFHTAEVTGSAGLTEGERYAVAVWVDTWRAEKPAAVELQKDRYTQTVTLEGRQTFLSRDGAVWENTQERYGTNVCLKVYTEQSGLFPAKMQALDAFGD